MERDDHTAGPERLLVLRLDASEQIEPLLTYIVLHPQFLPDSRTCKHAARALE